MPTPPVIRTTSSSAVRKGPTVGGPTKANILGGGKKPHKLGAKLVVGKDDFEEVERKAREEAERIARLGYDAEAEKAEMTNLAAATPSSPPKIGYTSERSRQRSPSEIDGLGMGIGRLGLGQTGSKNPARAPVPRKLAFGAVGVSEDTAGKGLGYILAEFC